MFTKKSPLLVKSAERDAVSHYEDLKKTFESLTQAVQARQCSQQDLCNQLVAHQAHIDGVGEYLHHKLKPIYWNERRAKDSVIAGQVLEIPELLELILENVSNRDVLSVCQVNKQLRNIIDASSRLQIQLCLRPANERSPLRTPFEHGYAHFNCRSSSFPFPSQDSDTICAAVFAARDSLSLRSIGQRWRAMLVCQPPIKTMTAMVECYVRDEDDAAEPTEEVSSEQGLTIGDLYDKATTLLRTHGKCQDCDLRYEIFDWPFDSSEIVVRFEGRR